MAREIPAPRPRKSVEIEGEAPELLAREPVEGPAILLRRVEVEPGRVRFAQLDERVLSRLDDDQVVAVALLGLVPLGAVVRSQRALGLLEELGVLALEGAELALDHVGEASTAEAHGGDRKVRALGAPRPHLEPLPRPHAPAGAPHLPPADAGARDRGPPGHRRAPGGAGLGAPAPRALDRDGRAPRRDLPGTSLRAARAAR